MKKMVLLIFFLVLLLFLVGCKEQKITEETKIIPATEPGSPIIFSLLAPSPLEATVGEPFSFSFCDPELTQTSDLCGAFEETNNPTGGLPPYHFQLESGIGFPPIGLNLNLNGLLNGTPQAAGTSNFRVCAVDTKASQKCIDVTIKVSEKKSAGFSGIWEGTATQVDICEFEGTMRLDLEQTGNKLEGSITLDLDLQKAKEGFEEFCVPKRASTSDLVGTVDGDSFTFSVPGSTFTGEGKLQGNQLIGTTIVVSAGVTTTGTFTLTKK